MAGAYCRYCDRRCFVDRVLPDGHKCGQLCEMCGHRWDLATCAPGMAHDLARTGYDSATAINPHAGVAG